MSVRPSHPANTGVGAPESEIEITPTMLAAGLVSADLISYQWGLGDEGILVSRVYRAMEIARRLPCAPWPWLHRERSGS